MNKESEQSPQHFVPKSQQRVRMESCERPPMTLPNPYVSNPRNNQMFTSPRQKPAATDGESDRRAERPDRNGHSNRHNDRWTTDASTRTYGDRSKWDPQTKKLKHISDSRSKDRMFGERSQDGSKRAVKGTRSAPSSARSTNAPPLAREVTFQVKMADFPELAVTTPGTSAPPAQTTAPSWGPNPQSQGPQTRGPSSPNKALPVSERSGGSPRARPRTSEVIPVSSASSTSPGQANVSRRGPERAAPAAAAVSSWANVAAQPPRKPVPQDDPLPRAQKDCAPAEQEDDSSEKKKRKRKKKKSAGPEEEEEPDETKTYQEPPKFEDEEEFPDLGRAPSGRSRLTTSSNTAKLCNEECQSEGVRPQVGEPNKDNMAAGRTLPPEAAKKGPKSEKPTGKKSKVPLQLDIGTMLAVLEKKKSSKQDTKPVVLTVGGALPVGLKQPGVQKKGAWHQDKIAHNPLDSTSPMVKKGKQREVPKAKKPTQLKRVILKEREERKHNRLLLERGLDPQQESGGLEPQQESRPAEEPSLEEPEETSDTDHIVSPALPEDVDADEGREEEEEEEKQEEKEEKEKQEEKQEEPEEEQQPEEQQTVAPPSQPSTHNRPKIHSRKFRDYCSQVLSKDVDECVSALLKELVRYQDRLYQKDPMKARMKKRLVMGLREVLKHLRLHKVKCVVISPNCERIQSKGGLDEALHTIIDTCREQGVPFVFALSRKALGRCVNKAVPVSLVGIFNYDGAQDFYHKMIELSSEARKAYEEMLERVEAAEQTEVELEVELEVEVEAEAEEEHPGRQRLRPGETTTTPPPPPPPIPQQQQQEEEEPEYIKVWKRMLEKDCNHQFLAFEEQLSSLRLDTQQPTQLSDGEAES